MLNFEVASFNSFRDIKNHLVTAEAAAEEDIGDSIKRKRICVSLNNVSAPSQCYQPAHGMLVPNVLVQCSNGMQVMA